MGRPLHLPPTIPLYPKIPLSPTNHLTSVAYPSNNFKIGILKRPWQFIKWEAYQKALFLLAGRNCKFYGNIGFNAQTTKNLIAVLDSGVSSSFIRLQELLEIMRRNIKELKDI